jgi:hypothetical protein
MQEDRKFETNLGYMRTLSQKKKQKQGWQSAQAVRAPACLPSVRL